MAECDRHRFSGLELLPTPMLEKIIEQDFKQEADYDPELIDYVLALMVQRAKNENPHSIPDIQSSWNKLQQRLDGEVDLGPLPTVPTPVAKTRKPSRIRPILRYVAVVAACVAIIFGAMITVQAMGVDVFGVLAEWTDSTFRFNTTQEKSSVTSEGIVPADSELRKSLADMELPIDFFPTWIPEGYSLSCIDQIQTKDSKGIYVTYNNPCKDGSIAIEIAEYVNSSFLSNAIHEKSSGIPESYIKNGKQFYLFKNNSLWTVAWSNGRHVITIIGIDSRDKAIAIINSIQEDPYE